MGIRGRMPFAGKSPDPDPCMPLLLTSTSFYGYALETSVLYNLRSQINNAQSSTSNLLAFCLASDAHSQQLPQGSGYRNTSGFPSLTSGLQHLVFKMSFHNVLFTAPSPSCGNDEKVIFIFQRDLVSYYTGLCIAHSLQLDERRRNEEEPNLISHFIKNVRWISDLTQPHSHIVETFMQFSMENIWNFF